MLPNLSLHIFRGKKEKPHTTKQNPTQQKNHTPHHTPTPQHQTEKEVETSLNFPCEKKAWCFLPELERLSSVYKSMTSTAVP